MNIGIDNLRASIKSAVSESPDAVTAARELHAGLAGPDIACVVFFSCTQYDLSTLAKELSELFKNVCVVGCTTAGEITPKGYQAGTITGFSLPGDQFVVDTCLIENLASFSVTQVNGMMSDLVCSVRERAIAPFADNTFAISLLDGLSIKQEEVLQALNDSFQNIPLVGGSAGDDLLFNDTHVYYDGRFYDNAAVIVLVNTVNKFQAMSEHHLVSESEKLVVTRADPQERTVYELNAEPAAEEYCRIFGLDIESLCSETFAQNPLAVQFSDETFVRAIQKVNSDKSLTFFCAVDIGVVLTKMKAESIGQHVRYMFDDIQSDIGDIQLVIAYDCIYRKIEIFEKGLVKEMSDIYKGYNFIGFNTYGEQFEGKHINHTLSCVAIGSRADVT